MTRKTPVSSSFDTLAVRGGEPHRHGYAALTTPIVATATYVFDDSAEVVAHFEGRVERDEYGRYGNPTIRVAEQKLAALDAAEDAVLFPSGMSAITTLLFALLKPGDHVVLTADCYRRTRQFVTTTLARYGIGHTLIEPGDHDALQAAIDPERTRIVIAEAPTNPYLRVADIGHMARVIKQSSRRAKLLVDATLATPVNLRPLALGADLVVHSCTKYLAGHNDVLAGSVAGNAGLIGALREARGVFGGIPDPHGAYLLVRGLKTLAVRMRQHNASGLSIARFLAEQPEIERVYYPGLVEHPDHAVAARQMAGFGGVISFLVRGDLERTSRFVDACQLPRIGPSMGGVESLIDQPALMSFYELSSAQRLTIGIRDNLVRLSVGLEDTEELRADLQQALAR